MRRFGLVTRIKPGMLERYKKLHDEIWDDVVRIGHQHKMRNYSIFLDERTGLMFSYYEYAGVDYEGDFKKKNSTPIVKKWQETTRECFAPVDGTEAGVLQILLLEIFHNDF
mgnify:CR=1 FL=1